MKRLLLIFTVIFTSMVHASEYPSADRWQYTMSSFALEDEIIGERFGAIVATGSSSMRFWDHRIHQDLAPLTIVSRGFGGSNMNDVLTYLDTLVLKHKPRAVMLYEADNDVAQGVPVQKILKTFEAAISRILEQDSKTRIYLLSVKPSISRVEMWPTMLEVNTGLQGFAEKSEQIIYIDVATPMLNDDGSMRDDLFVSDMLHMNQKGYDIWRNVVAPVLIQSEVEYERSPPAK